MIQLDRVDQNDRSTHVELTRQYVERALNLDQLIGLTHGLAAPGAAALELIAPLLRRHAPRHWASLGAAGLAPATVVSIADVGLRRLGALAAWTSDGIGGVLAQLADELRLPETGVAAALSVLILHERTPLSLPKVLAILQRDECIARLRQGGDVYRSMLLIG